MAEPDAADIQTDLAEAIQTVSRNRENGFVTRWCAIVESVAEDGSRDAWLVVADDMRAWDTLGLLDYAARTTNDSGRERVAPKTRHRSGQAA